MPEWRKYEHTPTLELISIIRKRKETSNEIKAQAAFEAFVFRYSQELSRKTEIICKNWGYSLDVAIEVSQRTFKRIWKYPKFDLAKATTKNVDNAVILYLFRIARNVLTDYVNELSGINVSPYDGSESIVWDFPGDEKSIDGDDIINPKTHSEVVKKAISTLSEKHKVVFLTYKKYEAVNKKLPRKLLEEIRLKLDISQTTVRSYKFEAYNKVDEYLELYGLKKAKPRKN